MSNHRLYFCLASLLAASALFTTNATSITFQSLDLPNVAPGEDLHQGILTVSGRTFNENEGFTVYFPTPPFSDFTDLATANPGWDIIVLGPSPSDVGYDALSLIALAETSAPFTFNFLFSGSGLPPGALDFEIYFFDGSTFDLLETGTTINGNATGVPDSAATGCLFALGAFALMSLRRAVS